MHYIYNEILYNRQAKLMRCIFLILLQSSILFWFWWTRSSYITQACLKYVILLLLPFQYWDYNQMGILIGQFEESKENGAKRGIWRKERESIIVIFRDNMVEHIQKVPSFVKRLRVINLIEYAETQDDVHTSHLCN